MIYYGTWHFTYLTYVSIQYRLWISLQWSGCPLMTSSIYLKGLRSRSITKIYWTNILHGEEEDDGDGILISHNFPVHDRNKNRYHFRELNVLVESLWNVVNHLNWIRFAPRNPSCLCSLALFLIKLIVID